MKSFKFSRWCAIMSLVTITIIFIAEISPLKGLGIVTFLILLTGIILWFISLIFFIAGLSGRRKENDQKKAILISGVLVISFIPIGLLYVGISGYINTKITVDVVNRSDYNASNILIYGTGNIFENSDTLRINKFNKGEKLEYIIRPSTAPFRNGYIKMEFDVDGKHVSKDIAGEFSINPYNIRQDWNIVVNNEFIK